MEEIKPPSVPQPEENSLSPGQGAIEPPLPNPTDASEAQENKDSQTTVPQEKEIKTGKKPLLAPKSLVQKLGEKDLRDQEENWRFKEKILIGLAVILLPLILFWPTLRFHYYKYNFHQAQGLEARAQWLQSLVDLNDPVAIGCFIDSLGEVHPSKAPLGHEDHFLAEFKNRGSLIKKFATPEIVPLLIERLQSPSPKTIANGLYAARALIELDYIRHHRPLEEEVARFVKSPNQTLKKGALHFLSQLKKAKYLIHFIDDLYSGTEARLYWEEIIIAMASEQILPDLVKRLNSSQERDQFNGALAISMLLENRRKLVDRPDIRHGLLQCLKAPNPLPRFIAARTLTQLATPSEFTTLLGHLEDADKDVQRQVVLSLYLLANQRLSLPQVEKAKGVLWAYLKKKPKSDEEEDKKDPLVEERVYLTLGQLGDRKATPHIVKILKTPKAWERIRAIPLVAKLQRKKAIPLLLDVIADKGENYRTLGWSQRWSQHKEVDFKIAAAKALSKLGARKAIPHLIRLLYHPKPPARIQAIKSLVMLEARQSLKYLKQRLENARGEEKTLLQKAIKNLSS